MIAWRLEAEYRAYIERDGAAPNDLLARITRFVQHYERITRSTMDGHRIPGAVATLDLDRAVSAFVDPSAAVTDM